MADSHTKEQRSYNMSRVRGKDTKPELLVRRFLHKRGFRFRLHDKTLPGKPDIVLKKHRTVIFVHGCFWHGHDGCKYSLLPQTRREFWQQKIGRNKELDSVNQEKIRASGWKVITVWGCDLKKDFAVRLERLIEEIT